MKHIVCTLLIFFFFENLYAQADKILGTWYNEPRDAKIEIYKKRDAYFGKIIWLKATSEPGGPKLDRENPDPTKRQRLIVGIDILTNLKWDASDKEWNGGEIYDPRVGETYSVYIRLKNANTLYIRGFIGISLLGRTTFWTRAK